MIINSKIFAVMAPKKIIVNQHYYIFVIWHDKMVKHSGYSWKPTIMTFRL